MPPERCTFCGRTIDGPLGPDRDARGRPAHWSCSALAAYRGLRAPAVGANVAPVLVPIRLDWAAPRQAEAEALRTAPYYPGR